MDFQGTARFEVLSALGAGGGGAVYAAFDREQGRKVALKVLRRADPAALLALKNEFRSVQDLEHPNLVHLGELFEEGGQWFFTMELIDGEDFLSFVRGGAAQPAEGEGGARYDEGRLREGLRQLCRALMALHDKDRVHRDVKPSNLLVDRSGRLVLLDFGLVSRPDLGPEANGHALEGTPAYMAPEQVAGDAVGAEADWYAVGVVLHEILTGRLPFSGATLTMMFAKLREAPPCPRDLAPDVPASLDELCVALLQPRPADRPRGAEVLARLADDRAELPKPHVRHTTTRIPIFLGREREMARLEEAFVRASKGELSPVLLHGSSGLGKSEMARFFIRALQSRHPDDLVVLKGRCYERESVPFKAFDGIVDALSLFLRRLPQVEVEWLLSTSPGWLVRVFPVLKRVGVLAKRALPVLRDRQEARRQAFGALKHLLARLAVRRPLLLFIDDLQWADPDSLRLLRVITAPPAAPSMCLLMALRTAADDRDSRGALATLAGALPPGTEELAVRPLPQVQARSLATALLHATVSGDEDAHVPERWVAQIAKESAGHPLFIRELVDHLRTLGERASDEILLLDDALWTRVEALDSTGRDLVELVSVAGEPIRLDTAAEAARLDPTRLMRLVSRLRVARLLRTHGPRLEDPVEAYHDRIREAVVTRLPADVRTSCHRRLAQAMLDTGQPEPARLAAHLEEAGEVSRAAEYAAEAARRAAHNLAFDRAARLFRKALELQEAAGTEAERGDGRELWTGLGDALANAGRGAEAAAAFQRALPGARAAEALELQRRAAEQLLRSGHIDEGMVATDKVLQALRMGFPKSAPAALISLLGRRAHLRLRGLGFRERDETQVSAERLVRVDLCRSVAIGLSLVDHVRGADFSTRFVLEALAAGELRRVLLALSMEVACVAGSKGITSRYQRRLLKAAEAMVPRVDDPISRAYLESSHAIGQFSEGCWLPALDHAVRAEAVVHEHGGTSWERAMMRFIILWSLSYLGRLRELGERVRPWAREAFEFGDYFAATGIVLGLGNMTYLDGSGPDEARRRVQEALACWSVTGYHFQHYLALLALTHVDLYEGNGQDALERVQADQRRLKRSLLLHLRGVRNENIHLRARAALAAGLGAQPSERKVLLSIASRDARRLARTRLSWALGLAQLVRAGVAAQRERPDNAAAALEAAIATLERAHMQAYAAAARRRLAELSGGDEGAEHRAASDTFYAEQGVRDPERMTALLAPGFPGL